MPASGERRRNCQHAGRPDSQGLYEKTGKFRAVINGIRQAARSVNPGDGKSDSPLDLSESGNTHNVLAAMDMPIAAMP